MFDKVLYFPHIRVPDNEWFTRALLYWDEVGTIVPHAPPDEVREILGEHTLRLMDAGLVSRVRAGDAREIPRFDEAFIELIEADPAIPTSGHPGMSRKTFSLHMTKAGHELGKYLEGRGLLEPTGSSWFAVEERTADLLMTYLACTLGACEYIHMTPITDRGAVAGGADGRLGGFPCARDRREQARDDGARRSAPGSGRRRVAAGARGVQGQAR